MNIISIRQERFNAPQNNVAFSANSKMLSKKMLQGVSENLLSKTMYSTDVVELSTVMKDPKKQKIFFATLGSLLTATAMKITELLTGGDKTEDKNRNKLEDKIKEKVKKNVTKADDKVNSAAKPLPAQENNTSKTIKPKQESVSIQKFLKHVGKASVQEKMLEASVNNIAERLSLNVEHQNCLISLYNKFCGVNHKGVSYDKENKEFANSFVAESIVKELEGCNDVKELENIVSRYGSLSKEKSPIALALSSNISVPKNIQLRQNIKEVYLSLDETQRRDVDEFLNFINEDERCKSLQKYVLRQIDKNYSHLLPTIASGFKLLEQKSEGDNKLSLVKLLSNDFLSIKALEQYNSDKTISNIMHFDEYNSLIYGNVSDEAIEELMNMRNRRMISEIKKNYVNDTFDLKFDDVDWIKSLCTLPKVFYLLNDGSEALHSNEGTSIYTEILSRNGSYPNLCKYLDVKGTKLNYGKEMKLMDIYKNVAIGKNLFTLHSYLRFLERFVMSEIKPSIDGKIYANQVKNKYKEKCAVLIESLANALHDSVTVETYTRKEGIKAPMIKIPYDNNDNYYTITINEQGKIHTIF